MMTDYNDGNWHVWHGGVCPVDAGSDVECRLREAGHRGDGRIMVCDAWCWEHDNEPADIIAFRVVKRAPREFWINSVGGHHRICRTEPDKPHGYTHVREVIE